MKVATCPELNATHAEIKMHWSLGELTDYLHLVDAFDAQRAIQNEQQEREAKRMASRIKR